MDRVQFEVLRDLPNKTIDANIVFTPSGRGAHLLQFDKVVIAVQDRPELQVRLNGSYSPLFGATKYNVHLAGVGPICRIDVNGSNHGDAGRTHKHSLTSEDDPRKNLPHAVPRRDLIGKTPREVFDDFCQQAQITFRGTFQDP